MSKRRKKSKQAVRSREEMWGAFEAGMDIAEAMDLPDGAFWAMAHDIADLEYGEGFDLLAEFGDSEEEAEPTP